MECQSNSGVKKCQMTLDEYYKRIETIEFEAQFSIYSSFHLVLLEMAENETLCSLRTELASNPENIDIVYQRIRLLLKRVEAGDDMPRDGSIAAYLYCLSKVDLAVAHRAVLQILETGGLWWSVQLAFHLTEHESEPA